MLYQRSRFGSNQDPEPSTSQSATKNQIQCAYTLLHLKRFLELLKWTLYWLTRPAVWLYQRLCMTPILLAVLIIIMAFIVVSNLIISWRTAIYVGIHHALMSSACQSSWWFPLRSSLCTKYDLTVKVFHEVPRIRVEGNEFETLGSRLDVVMGNNIYTKQLPTSMNRIQDAVSALRLSVKYSPLDQDIKDRLETEFETYTQVNELAIESTQKFLSGFTATTDMVLLQSSKTIRALDSFEKDAIQEENAQSKGNHMAQGIFLNSGIPQLLIVS